MSMKQFAKDRGFDLDAERIDAALSACILDKLWFEPDLRVIKHHGQLYFRRGRFEILCAHECAAVRRWRRR